MKNKQKKTSQSGQTTPINLQQKIFYQCYCAKYYLSYSALYLHVKNKHQHNLSFKSFCRKRTHWSGSVKNIILEFDEDAEEEKKKRQPLLLKLRNRKKNVCLKQSDSEVQSGNDEPIVKVQENIGEINEGKCITNVFELYWRTAQSSQIRNIRKQLLENFQGFINLSYQNMLPITGKYYHNYCSENTCEFVPLMLNQFFQQQYANSPNKDKIIYELKKLSDWLFSNGFTTQIVVKVQQYPGPTWRMEKIDQVKIQRAQYEQF